MFLIDLDVSHHFLVLNCVKLKLWETLLPLPRLTQFDIGFAAP